MKAIIMAGGEGTRLRPLTCNRPKPMVPIANKPMMEHTVELLKKYNILDIAVTLLYMPESIKEYFDDGKEFGVNMRYYIETVPLGTAGSVKCAEEFLDEPFIVISGDALTDADLGRAIEYHYNKDSIATLLLKKVTVPLEYGIVVTDSDGRIIRFLEKPSWGEVFSDTVNTGIYILSPDVLKYISRNVLFDFSKDLFPILLKEGLPMYGYTIEEYWCDIGNPGAYIQSHIDIMEERVKVNIPGKQIMDRVWVGEGTVIDDSFKIVPPCIIGKNNKIKSKSLIGEYSVIGDLNNIDSYSSIKRSIIWKNCMIDKNVELRGSILCDKVHFNISSSAFENSVIGDNTIIKNNGLIKPNIKVWPDKFIDENTIVNQNLVWGTKYTKKVFGNRGVGGEINIDITPEYASKLGAAYGAIFKEGDTVGVSSDSKPSSKMIKLAFITGILTTGIKVNDFGEMLLPIMRSAVRFYNFSGGIHIATSRSDLDRLYIDIMDSKGCNIDRGLERKIENIFIREDFSRCEGEFIKDISLIQDYSSFYLRNIINGVRSQNIKYRIALNAKSPYADEIMEDLLNQLGCKVEVFISHSKTDHGKGTDSGVIGEDIEQFSNFVKTNNFDLGVSLEEFSEKLILIDDRGRTVTEDMYMALIAIMLFDTVEGGTVVVPISASHIIEKIAKERKGKVIRTKTSTQDIMYKIMGNSEEEGMLEQFTLHFDAIGGLVKILDFMSSHKYKLSHIVDMIPDFHMDKREVECAWDAKGRVIKQIIQEQSGNTIETMEGVKIYDDNNSWVLILPDGERPLCKVISESHSQEFAEELSSFYVDKIKEISKNDDYKSKID